MAHRNYSFLKFIFPDDTIKTGTGDDVIPVDDEPSGQKATRSSRLSNIDTSEILDTTPAVYVDPVEPPEGSLLMTTEKFGRSEGERLLMNIEHGGQYLSLQDHRLYFDPRGSVARRFEFPIMVLEGDERRVDTGLILSDLTLNDSPFFVRKTTYDDHHFVKFFLYADCFSSSKPIKILVDWGDDSRTQVDFDALGVMIAHLYTYNGSFQITLEFSSSGASNGSRATLDFFSAGDVLGNWRSS